MMVWIYLKNTSLVYGFEMLKYRKETIESKVLDKVYCDFCKKLMNDEIYIEKRFGKSISQGPWLCNDILAHCAKIDFFFDGYDIFPEEGNTLIMCEECFKKMLNYFGLTFEEAMKIKN